MRTPLRPARLLLVLVTLLAALGACAKGGQPPPTPGPTASPTPSPSPSPSPTPETAVAPLTGVEVADDGVLERPVVAVKIENSAAARPQSGLDEADVVFEELTEGGITRFAALFQSRVPEVVGPIRSGRPEDASLLPPYDPMLFISGARPDVLGMLASAGLAFQEEDGQVLYRDRSRSSPHNLFARGSELFAVAEQQVDAAHPPGWPFAPQPPSGAVACEECEDDPGDSIRIRLSPVSTTRFDYDPDDGVYRRFQNDAPFTVTGQGRVGAANVVVVATDVRRSGCCDSAGNPLYETRTTGEGRAVVLRDGARYEGSWSKGASTRHLRVSDAAGRPFRFKPGPTWIVLAPGEGVPDVEPGEG